MKNCKKCNIDKDLNEFNKDKTKKDGLDYRCKPCRREYESKLYQTDKVQIYKKNYLKKYNQDNKEKQIEYRKKYNQDNKEKQIEYDKHYNQNNKEKIRAYERNRYKTDIIYNLRCNISASIFKSFTNNKHNKISNTQDILGCTFEEFKQHLEKLFEPWMTWENKGLYNGELNYGWDIDHIIPGSVAITIEDVIKLNHYTNLQPLCSKINRDIKRNRTDYYE
jgi:hypothetical protein